MGMSNSLPIVCGSLIGKAASLCQHQVARGECVQELESPRFVGLAPAVRLGAKGVRNTVDEVNRDDVRGMCGIRRVPQAKSIHMASLLDRDGFMWRNAA